MAVIFNECETSMASTAHSEEQQDRAVWERYLERKNLVLQFLHSNLNLHHLQHYHSEVEFLKKCYFYLNVEPKHVTTRDQNHVMHRADILQIINFCQFQKMKVVGKNQVEIQLTLLTELLDQLERGRQELSCYVETCDVVTFLSQWDLIVQKMSKLSEFRETFLSLQVPGKLYVKHRLVSQATIRGARLPNIKLSLSTKMPLIFDRQESFADKDWAKLKWFTENQESHLERCELHFKLLTDESQAEAGYGRSQEVTSNMCVIQGLQPGRSYEFTIKRSNTYTLVFGKWSDSITLKTKPMLLKTQAAAFVY